MATEINEKDVAYNQLKKEKEGLIHISYSEFSKYMECGHRHLIEKYLKIGEETTSIHLIFGNAIHSAIESGIKNKNTKDQRVEHFRYNFTKGMNDALRDDESFRLLDDFLAQGENIIRILALEKIEEKFEIISVEEPLYERLSGIYHFKGFIDLILRNRENKRYLITDWKTSTEPWDVSKKKRDEIFVTQMRLYKFFYGRKFNIPFDQIDCKYVVLNRMKNKKLPELGFGGLQPVEIYSNLDDIEKSVIMVAEAVKGIHVNHNFTKAKLIGRQNSCYFCPYKNNPTLCSNNPEQHLALLAEHGK
jgi:hypothetical protein